MHRRRVRLIRSAFISAFSCLLLHSSLYAQGSGVVIGRVVDQTDALIPGVAVKAIGLDSVLKSTVTDDQSIYRFDQLPAGRASVTFRLINVSTMRRSINVAAGEIRREDATGFV